MQLDRIRYICMCDKYFAVIKSDTHQLKGFNFLLPVTLVSWILEHMEISEHLTKFVEKLIVEHLFSTISIAMNKTTPGTFSSLYK